MGNPFGRFPNPFQKDKFRKPFGPVPNALPLFYLSERTERKISAINLDGANIHSQILNTGNDLGGVQIQTNILNPGMNLGVRLGGAQIVPCL